MEKIIKLAKKNYDFGLQSHLLNPYFHDLSTKPANVEVIVEYTIKELRAKKANASLLFIFNAFVEKCPGSVFSKHGSNWIQLLIRNAADNHGNLSLILKLLTKILHNLVINNFKKELDSKQIEKCIEFCTQVSSSVCTLDALNCLEVLLKSYPEHCSFVSKNIHKYLLGLVDSPVRDISFQVGVCFLYLYQVKGGLCKGGTLEQSWAQLQNSLLANLYSTMNSLLEEELFVDSKIQPAGMLLETTQSKPVLCQRVLNLTSHLDSALLIPLGVAKPIYASKILDLISAVLDENSPLFANKNLQRDITIGPYLHHIHRSYLKLLRTMMIVLRSNALLFNRTICGVLKIVLKRSSRTGYHPYQTEYGSQKIFIYELIQEWIQIARSGQDVETVIQKTFDDIWGTFQSFEAVIKENNDDKAQLLTKDKGSRKRKRNEMEESLKENKARNITHIVESCSVIAAALDCLNRILMIFGHSLNSTLHHSVLVNIHVFAKKLTEWSMQENVSWWSDDYNLFEGISKVLITFNSSSHHLHRSSINYTLSLLEMIRSCEPQNRKLCLAFQNTLETIFHYPRRPVVIINPSSALLQEPEVVEKETPQEVDSDEEMENEDGKIRNVMDLSQDEADEHEISSTVNGQAEVKIAQEAKELPEKESIEIADEDDDVEEPTCISSADEDDIEEVPQSVVILDEESEEKSVHELPKPVEIKKSRQSQSPAQKEPAKPANPEQQASVDDIMSEFVSELLE